MTATSQKPNLFIVGAMKSGTTSLHNYLHKHPEIYMSEVKEPGFFVEEISWGKGFRWYETLFAEATNEKYVGESSTDYTKLPIFKGVTEKIARYAPNAKLIYVVRDPFERMVSHYWHAVRHISTGGVRKNIFDECNSNPEYLAFSCYADQIRPYLEKFGREQIYVLSFEELTNASEKTVNDIYQWLGLESMVDLDFSSRWNAKPAKQQGIKGPKILSKIRYSKTWDKIADVVPKSVRSRASNLVQTEIDESSQAASIAQLRKQVISQLAAQANDFFELTGKDYSQAWDLYN